MEKSFITTLAVLGIGMGTCTQNPYEDIDVNRFGQTVKSDSAQLVDVCKLGEFIEGHTPSTIHIDVLTPSFLSNALAKLDKKRPCVVYCRSDKCSAIVAALLAKEEYTVTSLLGGIIVWTEAEKKTVRE